MLIRPVPQEPLALKPKVNAVPNLTDAQATQSSNAANLGPETPSGTGTARSGSKKAPPQDPLAREALVLVGLDPEAEAVWVDAINNPDLPPKERQDLIEDLNEEGFADPKNLTPDDLPLILNRLELIFRRNLGEDGRFSIVARRNSMTTYRDFHRESLSAPETFWRNEATLIDWHTPFDRVLDYSNPPFATAISLAVGLRTTRDKSTFI